MADEKSPLRFDTVAIIGVGLIGGSIGKSVLRRKLSQRVVGIGRDPQRLRRAYELGAVTDMALDVSDGVESADVVFICTPVDQIAGMACQVASVCSDKVLITDVGSTKAEVLRRVSAELKDCASRFVGSHPLAGGEKSGVEFSSADLFEDRTVIVTPVPTSDPVRVAACKRFWTDLGAVVHEMSTDEHDAVVAATSHVPHVLAAILASATPTKHLPLASTGWLDTTRVAGGNVEMWCQIIDHNREQILDSLRRMHGTFDEFLTGLQQRDFAVIRKILQEGKANRDSVAN